MCKRKVHTVQQYKLLKKLITNASFLLLVYTFIQNILSVEQKRLYYCMRFLKNMSSTFCILKQNNFSVTIFLWHIFTIQFRTFLLSNFSLHRDKTLRVLPHTSDNIWSPCNSFATLNISQNYFFMYVLRKVILLVDTHPWSHFYHTV